MKVIVCVDDKNGMLFNNRRQSSDRMLRERMLALVGRSRLWMNAYSAKQFLETTAMVVDETFLDKAQAGEYCFVENVDVLPFADTIEEVILYRWNTVYPSDVRFPMELIEGKTPVSTADFAGHSHPKITEEIVTSVVEFAVKFFSVAVTPSDAFSVSLPSPIVGILMKLS